jgi:Flp pilus assembly protein TadD/tRNA A-37 threonylcarbamoyl transferase component Bud32/TolB-like protein
MQCPKCGSKILNDSHFCRMCGSDVSSLHEVTDRRQERTTPSYAELTPGSVFEGRYTILDELGRGGMGVVYKAEDSKLRRNVALKFLPSTLIRNREAKERFRHEAQAASALDHPNICTVYEIDETANGRMYISMGCYEGRTLDKMIEHGPLGVEEATGIAIQCAQGLAEAHEKGIVHRDVKPSNIIVTTRGQAKIMDFGLAKLTGKTRLTQAGTTMGTIAYMSPEQAQGEDVDHRTDIWSLGTVLYEMVTGREPFPGDYDQAVIYSILNEEVRPASDVGADVPPEIDNIINKCLKKDPEERYKTALNLEAELRSFRKDSGMDRVALYGGAVGSGKRGRRNLRVMALWSTIAVAAVLALLIVPASRNALRNLLTGEPAVAGKRVAVLPCNLVGGTPEDQAFCDGLTWTLASRFAKIGYLRDDLTVIAPSAVRGLESRSPSEAHKQLGANIFVSGSMRLSDEGIRLVLIRNDLSEDTGDDSAIQTLEERRSNLIADPLANLSTWQDSIPVILARLLDIGVTPEEQKVLLAGGTTVPRAYELYLKGMGYVFPYEIEEDPDAGVSMFRQAINADSSYALAYLGLGEAYLSKLYCDPDTGFAVLAIDACDRALACDDRLADAHAISGFAHYRTGNPEEATRRFQTAVQLDSTSHRAFVGLGQVYSSLGEFGLAEDAYREAVKLLPHDPYSFRHLGFACLMGGNYEGAIEAYSRTAELDPDDQRSYTNLGVSYFCLDRLGEARDAFEKSLAISPSYMAAANLGNIYYWEARYADAARMYEDALDLDARDYRVWGHLADCYYWCPGEKERAEAAFRKAIELAGSELEDNPNSCEILSNLASYHAMIGNTSEAEGLLEQAVAQVPGGHEEMLHIAEAYEKLGHRQEALDWVGAALENGATAIIVDRYPGLGGLRGDPRFRQIREQAETESTTMIYPQNHLYGRG